jgi:hypothetical protein
MDGKAKFTITVNDFRRSKDRRQVATITEKVVSFLGKRCDRTFKTISTTPKQVRQMYRAR